MAVQSQRKKSVLVEGGQRLRGSRKEISPYCVSRKHFATRNVSSACEHELMFLNRELAVYVTVRMRRILLSPLRPPRCLPTAQIICLFYRSSTLIPRAVAHRFTKKCSRHLRILVLKRVTRRKLRTENPKILGAIIQNFVALISLAPEICTSLPQNFFVTGLLAIEPTTPLAA